MKRYITDESKVGPWVCAAAGSRYFPGNNAIGLEVDGELKLGIYYDTFTGSNICMHSRCDDPHITTRRFYFYIFDYPFNELKVKRCTAVVSEANVEAQRIDEKLGFKLETRIKDYFPEGDALIYVMRREDCRWLKFGERYA